MNIKQHATAEVHTSSRMGEGCTLGAYSRIGAGVRMADGCEVAEHAVVDGEVELGRGVIVGAFSHITGRIRLADGVRIGPAVCLYAGAGELIEVRKAAVIGPHATIGTGVIVGDHAVVGAGAVVMKNVPATAIVSGNPAKITGYAAAINAPLTLPPTDVAERRTTSVRGVTLHHLPVIEDLRGNLSFGEGERHIPFSVKRYFLTFDVATEEARGEHAHRRLEQFLVCVNGRVHIMADDGATREEFVLDRPNTGLYLPPMVWGVQYRYSPGAVLMVLCSDYYDPADYIRDYPEFLALARASGAR